MIEIVPYRDEWRAEYTQIADLIRQTLGDVDCDLHHIGSTAVPGLAAKDIIDIQLSLPDLNIASEKSLTQIGFQPIPNRCDHCPPGKRLPAAQLEKRFYKYGPRSAHLHVRERGRFNQRYPLLCRDYLRTHSGAAKAYEEIKQQLAIRFPSDAASYYAIKDPTFDLIMAAAESWAAETKWTIPDSD